MADVQERPLVTFALISYNQEKFIREAVEGALAQDYEPLEIIISDDHSEDATFEIATEVVSKYVGPHNIVLIKNEKNMGIGGHIAKIINNSGGVFVVMAAGDDVSYSNRVRVAYEEMKMFPNALGFISGFDYINNDSKKIGCKWVPDINDFSIEKFSRGFINFPGASAAWKKDVLLKWSKIDSVVHEDRVFPFRIALLGGCIVVSDRILVSYRSSGGISRSNIDEFLVNPRNVRLKALKRVQPDAVVRLADFEQSTQMGYLKNIHKNLQKTLKFIDIEISALGKGGLGLEIGYLKIIALGGNVKQSIQNYIKIRFSYLYWILKKSKLIISSYR